MIKRIIFDIDDTLISFPKGFEKGYNEVLKKNNLDIEPKLLYKIIDEYETSGKYKYYDVDKLLNLINERLNIKLSNDFADDFFNMYNKLITPVSNEVVETLKYLKDNNIHYLILGNGSNVILARPNFDVVIKLDRINNIEIKDNIVIAGAGVSLIKLSNICMENNLNGLSFAGGIPGLLGASTAMNAGAYKEDMASIVKEVKVLTPNLEIKTMKNSELEYAYRDSFLKRNKDFICVEVTLSLEYEDKEIIKMTIVACLRIGYV